MTVSVRFNVLFISEFFIRISHFQTPRQRNSLGDRLRFETPDFSSAEITSRNVARFNIIGVNNDDFCLLAESP